MPAAAAPPAHACDAPLAAIPVVPASDPDQAAAALERVGTVVVRQVIPLRLAEELAAEVRSVLGDPGPAASCHELAFVERSPSLLSALGQARFLRVAQALVGHAELTVNRSAAIVRTAGSPLVGWHMDFDTGSGPPTTTDGVLNRGASPAGLWFYLTGCRPDHGGLWVMPGSHRPGWRPDASLRLSADQRVLLQPDGTPARLASTGAVPVYAEPGDLVAFAARTFHAAAPLETGMRLSCGLGLRPRAARITAPWPLPEETRRWLDGAPTALRPLLEGYVGYPHGWPAR